MFLFDRVLCIRGRGRLLLLVSGGARSQALPQLHRVRLHFCCGAAAAARGVRLYATALLTLTHYMARVLLPGYPPCHPR